MPTPEHRFEQFRCEVVPDRERVRVCPVGALDIASVAVVCEQIVELQEAGFALVVLDLGHTSFVDCAGARLIATQHAWACENGHRFALTAASRAVQRVLDFAGAADVPTLDDRTGAQRLARPTPTA